MLTRPDLPRERLTAAGALPATVDLGAGQVPDETGFVTALGLRALRAAGSSAAMRGRMLDFLERCQVGAPAGAFAFWPEARRPAWARRIPADADDTAVCLTELHLAGRVTRAEAIRRAVRLLLPNRVRRDGTPRPAWIPAGAFLTWLTPEPGGPNIVDCAANANILALLAVLGMRDPPGRRDAVRLILDGLAWAGSAAGRLRALTPYYPDPAEFRLAVEHAVARGCPELAPAAAQLRRLTGCAVPGPDATICSDAYTAKGWRSAELAALRLA